MMVSKVPSTNAPPLRQDGHKEYRMEVLHMPYATCCHRAYELPLVVRSNRKHSTLSQCINSTDSNPVPYASKWKLAGLSIFCSCQKAMQQVQMSSGNTQECMCIVKGEGEIEV